MTSDLSGQRSPRSASSRDGAQEAAENPVLGPVLKALVVAKGEAASHEEIENLPENIPNNVLQDLTDSDYDPNATKVLSRAASRHAVYGQCIQIQLSASVADCIR